MRNLFVHVRVPMVIFCEGSLGAWIGQIRAEAGVGDLTHIVSFPWHQLESHKHAAHWRRDLSRDPHRSIHNTNLYAIWNEKMRFVDRAIKLNPFRTEWFCWCDAGYFRNAAEMAYYRTWPSASFVAGAMRDKLYITAINPFLASERGNASTSAMAGKVRLAAGVMFAHAEHWTRMMVPQYYALQGYLIAQGQFAGREETVLNVLCLRYPGLFQVMHARGTTEQDRWFWGRKAFLNAQAQSQPALLRSTLTDAASTAAAAHDITSLPGTFTTGTPHNALFGQSHSAVTTLLDGRRFRYSTPKSPAASFNAVEWETAEVLCEAS